MENNFKANLKYIYKCDPLNAIGFDEIVSGLEIESLNESQISVKHCVTNIVIHFDVTVVPVTPNVSVDSRLISCKPLHDGPARAFKCDNIIINDILPAELCTVMPKMMRDILRSMGAHSSLSRTQVPTQEIALTQTVLPAISEAILVNDVEFVPHIKLSKEMLEIIAGNFKPVANRAIFKPIRFGKNTFEVSHRSDLLTTPKMLWHLNAKIRAMPRIKEKLLSVSNRDNNMSNLNINELKTVPHCTALQPYIGRESRLISCDDYTLSNMAQNIINIFMGQPICSTTSYLYPLLNTILDRKLSINIEQESTNDFSLIFDKGGIIARITNKSDESKAVIIVDYVDSDSNMVEKNNSVNNNVEHSEKIVGAKTLQIIEYVEPDDSKQKTAKDLKDVGSGQKLQGKCRNSEKSEKLKNSKNKKKKFVKLRVYKKCKSATNVLEKPDTTPLSKINCLDDFFQALGQDRSLASVFDGTPANKILEYLKEVNKFISLDVTILLLFLLKLKPVAHNAIGGCYTFEACLCACLYVLT